MQTVLEILRGGKWSLHTLILLCTAWTTWQIGSLEEKAWTVHMQAEWAQQVALHNPTNWIPNAYIIFYAVKDKKTFIPQRVGQ